jgi:hypothetical protein
VLVVEVSLWPDSDASASRTIARAAIANVSHMDAWTNIADYVVYVERESELPDAFVLREHRREDGAWELVRRLAAARTGDDTAFEALPQELRAVADRLAEKLADVDASDDPHPTP